MVIITVFPEIINWSLFRVDESAPGVVFPAAGANVEFVHHVSIINQSRQNGMSEPDRATTEQASAGYCFPVPVFQAVAANRSSSELFRSLRNIESQQLSREVKPSTLLFGLTNPFDQVLERLVNNRFR